MHIFIFDIFRCAGQQRLYPLQGGSRLCENVLVKILTLLPILWPFIKEWPYHSVVVRWLHGNPSEGKSTVCSTKLQWTEILSYWSGLYNRYLTVEILCVGTGWGGLEIGWYGFTETPARENQHYVQQNYREQKDIKHASCLLYDWSGL